MEPVHDDYVTVLFVLFIRLFNEELCPEGNETPINIIYLLSFLNLWFFRKDDNLLKK